jgi:thymidylate kinase
VYAAYAALAVDEPGRIRRIDAAQSIEKVHADIWAAVETHIAAHSLSKGAAHV